MMSDSYEKITLIISLNSDFQNLSKYPSSLCRDIILWKC